MKDTTDTQNDRNTELRHVNIRVAASPDCNLHCVYCGGSFGRRPGRPAAMEDFRKKRLDAGTIGAKTLLEIIKVFHDEGFFGVSLTGGEPLLNPEWDFIVEEMAKIGMGRIEVTTNGTLLSGYLDRKGSMPNGLTLVKVSLDTFNASRFRRMTKGGEIVSVLDAVRAISPHTKTRANRVLLRRDMNDLVSYLELCSELGFHEANLLDLVAYPNRDDPKERLFFEREYVPFPEVSAYLYSQARLSFDAPDKYGHQTHSTGGMRIVFKDSRYTMRDDQCQTCPVYCQEGKYNGRQKLDREMAGVKVQYQPCANNTPLNSRHKLCKKS